ncbi:MAG: sigma-70 family RNA polymerase sigma factor [Oscillospiraceae bacterium]|nr:sigma-70 family RNA polymerase sigma factor [Oscillospiraceae bacterium]
MQESNRVAEWTSSSEEELVAAHTQLVRRCARPYFLAGGDGEDLIQEGMLGLLSAIRRFDPERGVPFHAYAEICIRRRVIDAVRRAAQPNHLLTLENRDSQDHSDTIDIPDHSPISDPLVLVIAKERAHEISDLLDSELSKFEFRVLRFYLDGLSYDEIATRVGKNTKSVDNAVQRIRRKLQRITSDSTIGDTRREPNRK